MFLNTITASAAKEVVTESKGLGLDGIAIAFYLLCFVIAMVVLNKFLFAPLMKILDERETRIQTAFDQVEEVEGKIANCENQAKSILAAAHSQARQIVDEAKGSVDAEKQKVIADANENANSESQKIISTAKSDARNEVLALVQKTIQKATANLSISQNAQNEILVNIINTKI
jgi:ATP synthase F0 subunit b